jgi:hypothetical protein
MFRDGEAANVWQSNTGRSKISVPLNFIPYPSGIYDMVLK